MQDPGMAVNCLDMGNTTLSFVFITGMKLSLEGDRENEHL